MFEYKPVHDTAAVLELAKRAFALRRPDQEAAPQWLEQAIEDGRELHGVFEEDRLLAVFLLYDYRMRLRNAIVPMGGIGLLCSRLDARGKGAVRLMIERSLETMRDKGHAVSVLDPFRASFYRKYGWERFSRLQRLEIGPDGLVLPGAADPDHEIADLSAADEAVMAFYNRYACSHYTLIQRSAAEWRSRTEILPWHMDTAARGVVRVSRGDSVVGLIGYDMSRKPDEWPPTFSINLFLYEDEAAKRAMLGHLTRLSHQIKTLRFDIPTDEDFWPYILDTPEKSTTRDMFMIRIVWLEALDGLAIEANDMQVAVEVVDDQAPWNAGTWRLAIEDGTLRIASADQADLKCGIGALSSVLSGFTDFATLIVSGLAEPLRSYAGQDLPQTTTFLVDYF